MASVQRKHGDNKQRQNTKKNTISGLPKETSELSTFDKLMLYLTKTHPDYSKSDFAEALYAYRNEQQTLAGLSLTQIEEGVLNIVRNKHPTKQVDNNTIQIEESVQDKTEQSVTAALWSTFKRYREREQSSKKFDKNNEDQCLICLENLSSNKTETFSCQHTFHRNCLEEWFKIERTCPLCRQGNDNVYRRRRQTRDDGKRNADIPSRNPDRLVSSKNIQFNPNNQQQSSQGQQEQQPSRPRGFYHSPEFKPPSFSGEKPAGWFDTKYPYWVSNQDGQSDKSNIIDGKNAAPSSLQGKGNLPRREDGGAFFLQKAAKHYYGKGEKAFNIAALNAQQRRGSMCTNTQNFNGYTFNKFPCPLPPGTGMNQLDQYCCGPANYQYCCNVQEYNQDQAGGYGNNVYNSNQRHGKTLHYSPRTNRTLAIVLPIVGLLVLAGAGIIVFLYYKKLQTEQGTDGKSTGANRLSDNYSAVPQDPPSDKPAVPKRGEQKPTVQT
ncbi:unnamed protein product [Adineta steineri]|uniref:RING-type domain-containing protein n=1 Tax=Adineta steineri TaxID=433720 RepID=A0A819FGE1_9BILA|nr:unnamed protein product [Adineta steineri]CAF3868013.1 unnamed protein product [Adineta steineri]